MPADKQLTRGGPGFEGELTTLGLSDVIQLDVVNRFSGCIDVEYQGRRGLIFLTDGAVVHAEQGAATGEAAFYEIVSWPGGRFSHQENVATTRTTIRRSCQFLILEAHRLADERRAKPGAAAPPPLPAAGRPPASALLRELRAIPGVLYAVIQGKDGRRVGDDSYEAEVLAGQALYLAMVDRRIGEKLRAGDAYSAVVRGAARHLLLFTARSHLVSMVVDAAAEVGAVEAAARKALTPGR